jgi:hypothetical protein
MRKLLLVPLAAALVHAAAFAGPQMAWSALTYKPRPAEIDEIKGCTN